MLHQVACGGEHTLVISKQGRVFAWGRGNVGQTGLGSNDTTNVPTCVQTLEGQHITQVQPLQPAALHMCFGQHSGVSLLIQPNTFAPA